MFHICKGITAAYTRALAFRRRRFFESELSIKSTRRKGCKHFVPIAGYVIKNNICILMLSEIEIRNTDRIANKITICLFIYTYRSCRKLSLTSIVVYRI